MDLRTSPQAPNPRPRILLVEDDDGVRRSLHLLLQSAGFDVRSYSSAGPLLEDPALGDATGLVSDYLLPDCDGLDLLRAMRDHGWEGRSILITAVSSDRLRDEARAAGYDTVLEKPLRRHDLIAALG